MKEVKMWLDDIEIMYNPTLWCDGSVEKRDSRTPGARRR